MNKGLLWATPDRRAHLVNLVSKELPNLADSFYKSIDRLVFGDIRASYENSRRDHLPSAGED